MNVPSGRSVIDSIDSKGKFLLPIDQHELGHWTCLKEIERRLSDNEMWTWMVRWAVPSLLQWFRCVTDLDKICCMIMWRIEIGKKNLMSVFLCRSHRTIDEKCRNEMKTCHRLICWKWIWFSRRHWQEDEWRAAKKRRSTLCFPLVSIGSSFIWWTACWIDQWRWLLERTEQFIISIRAVVISLWSAFDWMSRELVEKGSMFNQSENHICFSSILN